MPTQPTPPSPTQKISELEATLGKAMDFIEVHKKSLGSGDSLSLALLMNALLTVFAGWDVVCLAQSDCVLGAAARMRGVYECDIRTRAMMKEPALAERWIDHETRLRLADQEDLGKDPVAITALELQAAGLVQKYGPGFASHDGWFAGAIDCGHNGQNGTKGHGGFKRLRCFANAGSLGVNPDETQLYQLGNHAVHLDARGGSIALHTALNNISAAPVPSAEVCSIAGCTTGLINRVMSAVESHLRYLGISSTP